MYPSSTVFLNVYDIVPHNAFLSPLGLGVHHSGIEVFGMEFAFGRCRQGTGVFECQPKRCPGHAFRESLVLGCTPYSERQIEEWFLWLQKTSIEPQVTQGSASREQSEDDESRTSRSSTPPPTPTDDDGRPWTGPRYHLLTNNCNHFSAYVARKLLPATCTPTASDATAERGVVVYDTGQLEELWVTKEEVADSSGILRTLTTPLIPTAAVGTPFALKRVKTPTRVPAWVNRAATVAATLLPDALVQHLDALDREAQCM